VTAPPPATGESKSAFRQWARAKRAALEWEALSAAVVEYLVTWLGDEPGRTVLAYLPLPDEINLLPLMESATGARFVVTRTPDRGGDLAIHELVGPLEVHRLGFLQPHRSSPQLQSREVDIALLPGLAFDLFGNRLGRGGGYFDKLLPQLRPGARKVGVVPTALVVDQLPVAAHDVPMDYLATEEGVIATA
jgi:5-formyltetrahydrofolate cyclo-ligase